MARVIIFLMLYPSYLSCISDLTIYDYSILVLAEKTKEVCRDSFATTWRNTISTITFWRRVFQNKAIGMNMIDVAH